MSCISVCTSMHQEVSLLSDWSYSVYGHKVMSHSRSWEFELNIYFVHSQLKRLGRGPMRLRVTRTVRKCDMDFSGDH